MLSDGAGIFGKAPETGDFISRGLTPPLRRALDLWVTKHLAPRRSGWPLGGLRGLLELDGGLFLFVAVPSADSVGRRFPLAAMTGGAGLSLETAEAWCDAALPSLEGAAAGTLGLDAAWTALEPLTPKPDAGPDGSEALWTKGQLPVAADAEGVAELFDA